VDPELAFAAPSPGALDEPDPRDSQAAPPKQGRVSGSAHAYAPAAKTRASYEWEYAPAGGAWISLPFTLHADVVLEGLAAGVLYFLRVRSVTKEGFSDWSELVSFRVT
jgi:hypothetical protein